MRRVCFVIVLVLLVGCDSQGLVTPTVPPSPTGAPTTVLPSPTVLPTPTSVPTAPPATALPTQTAVPTPTPLAFIDPASGRSALVRGALTQRPFIAMLDNHPDAYPQTGLDEAALVFEGLAEFGITRYMAVYAPELVAVQGSIGPIRSARIYFVQWAMGLRGIYVHAGGSPSGLDRLAEDANTFVINLDALHADHEGAFFRRDGSRFAPHNLYTSQAEIQRFLDQRIGDTATDLSEVGYLFDGAGTATTALNPVSEVAYYFIYADDSVSWSYDATAKRYWRFRRGRPHIDAVSGEQLWFKSVVVMQVDEAPIAGDPKGRIDQDVIGEGPAVVFANGDAIDATWRKERESAPLRFYDGQNNEIKFPLGPLWIAAVPDLGHLSTSP